MIRPARRWVVGIASASLVALSLPAVTTTAVLAVSQQSGPFWPGNLLSMANADFENGVGDWSAISGANTLTTDSTAYLHNSALKIVASGTSPITSVLRLSGIEIPVNPGGTVDTYRVGAYIKMPARSGLTTEFDLACYDANGTFLQWYNGTQVNNSSDGNWHWVEDDITLSSTACANVQGSPRVKFAGLNNNDTIHMDEVWFAPERAALMIGADDPCSSTTSCDWKTQNATDTTGIGPLQTEKEFFGPDTTLPNWSDSSNDCYNIEQVYSSDHSKWPLCIIAFKYDAGGTVQTTSEIEHFLQGMQAYPDQTILMVFWQEAEDTYPGTYGQFTTDFQTEASNIRAAAAAENLTENVFVAQDSSTYQYYGGDGVGCHWIVPSSYTDYYLADHYTRNETSGGASLPNQPSPYGSEWTGWLNCVQGNNKPIGLAEYGMCSGGGSLCKGNPCPGGTSNTSDITKSIADDNTYLAGNPGGTEPVALWSYWQYSGSCNYLTPGGAQALQWQSNETQNGGAVGG